MSLDSYRESVSDFATCLEGAGFTVVGPIPDQNAWNYRVDHAYFGVETVSVDDLERRSLECEDNTLAPFKNFERTEQDRAALHKERVEFIGCLEGALGIDISKDVADGELAKEARSFDPSDLRSISLDGADFISALTMDGQSIDSAVNRRCRADRFN